ncbi:uncharacterized protein LOC126319849 [Schistocerca gregaria]|uniref:uncharacterized protein LOC126319849 n=1 Tax=Schistocerca gregaria TaxID=7010 RepID=UPI00211EB53F|nr:uncharacterized protein LOC126319849 [Schistocerca gregaria]
MDGIKRVLVTGAAGNIGYAIIPLIASGQLLGPDQPIILHLLEIPPCKERLEGVRMEIEDCCFPLLKGIVATTDSKEAFTDIDIAILVGSVPRTAGMERKELLSKNGTIFREQGTLLNQYSKKNVKVAVIGNPANTNALIAQAYAPNIPKENFTAMTRLDHNRACALLASKTGTSYSNVKNVIIWGNHSSTQYPDVRHAVVNGKNAIEAINDDTWLKNEFISCIQQRGATIIKARGMSSAFSAAVAAVNHVHDWILGTPEGKWTSMGVSSDGSYGIPVGVIYSYPVICKYGKYEIVQNLKIDEYSRALMDKTYEELLSEKTEAYSFLGLSA